MRPGRGAGEYNSRLKLQQNRPSENADGQKKQKWYDVGKVWAQVVPRGGREKRIFEQLRAEISHIVRVRFGKDSAEIVPADYRFVTSDSSALNIESRINIDSRNVEFEYRCTEIVISA